VTDLGVEFDPTEWPRRLNLGCGWDRRVGYLNVDFLDYHHPDLVADVRDLSMLPSGQYEEIVAQDVLEHLTRADGPKALAEWARLLRPDGKLVLRVPNLLGLAYIFTQMTTIDEQKNLVQCLFGTQAYDGDFHQNGYTEFLLRHELRAAGFGKAEITPFCEWLFDVVATKCEPEDDLRIEDCIFMTLQKPSEAAVHRSAASALVEPAVTPPPHPNIAPSPAATAVRQLKRLVMGTLRRARAATKSRN
jgi:hypothetical protein